MMDCAKAAFGGALVNRTIDFKDLAFRLKALVSVDLVHDVNTTARLAAAFDRVISTFLEGFSIAQRWHRRDFISWKNQVVFHEMTRFPLFCECF